MKHRSVFFLVCLFVSAMFVASGMDRIASAQSQPDTAPPDTSEEASPLKTQKEQVNYAIGVSMIGNFKKQGVDIDLNMVMKGMQDAASGGKLLMSGGEITRALKLYYSEVRKRQTEIMAETAAENKKAEEAFLAENKKKKGIVTLPSGLQYKIIQSGDGKKPAVADTVEVEYRGTLINGNEFDSSYRTGGPATFTVKDIIPGWQEALLLMPVGSTWQLFIPSSLAYGEQGAGGIIEPNSMLIFEVKLLGIK